MDLKSLKRKELQSLCKKHGISANIASSLMIEKLEPILENEQKNQRRGCLKRSGESSSENLGVSQKNVTFVVDESKEIDEKPNRASKRKTVRVRTETNTSENIVTEAVKKTTRSKGLSESVLRSPVIEKKKVKNGPENVPVIVEENVTRPLRNRSVTVNDNDLKGGRKRKVSELNEETTTKTVEPSRSTRSRSKEDVKVETQSGKSSEKEEENVKLEVLPSRSRSTRSSKNASKKSDENEDEKAAEVQGNKRRKVDVVVNESLQSTRSTPSSSSVLLDVGTCVFNPGKAVEKRMVQDTKGKRLASSRIAKVEEENVLPIAEKSKMEKFENQAKVAAVKPSRTTRGSSKVLKEDVPLPLAEAKESKKKEKVKRQEEASLPLAEAKESKKEKVKKQEEASLPLAEAKESKKEKVKKQEDVISHAKRSTRSGLKASEDIIPVEKSRNLKSNKQLKKKFAVTNENVTTNVRSTRNTSKNVDDLDPLSAVGSGKKSGKQASKVLTETEMVISPTSRPTRSSVKVVENEFLSPKIETGHKSVGIVLSHTASKTTRSSSRMSGKARFSPKGGKSVSTPKKSATKSSSKLLEHVLKEQESATKESFEDATTPTRSTRSSIKLDTSVEHGDSHPEIVMTSSRRSAQKVSKGSGDAEEAGNDKPSKNSKSSASKIDGDVQKTKDDRQTSIARKSLRSSSKQGDTNVGKSIGKKRTRTTAMEGDSPVSHRKSSKRLHKDLPIEGKSSGIIDSSIKQLTDSEALESDRVTETEPVESATLTETRTGNNLDQFSVPESGPSQLDNLEDASGLNLGSNINENLFPEIDLEKLPSKGKIIDESMDVSADKVTETEPLDSVTLTDIKDGNALDQNNVPESRLTQLDNLEGANGLNLGSSIDVSVDKVTKTELLESTTLTETEAGIFLDQSNVPESKPSQLDNLEDADGLNLGSCIDVSVDKVTETEPLESVTLTETVAGNILDQNNVPESRPSQLDNLEDADGLNLGSSIDVSVDKVTETEALESETVTGIKDNVVDKNNIPESRPSQLDNLEDADGLNLGSSMNVSLDEVTETELLELKTPTEINDGNVVDQNSVPESRPYQLDNLEDADGSNMGSSMNVYVDKVTETEPVESVTLTEIEDGNVMDQNSVPESRPSELDNLEDADGSNLGSSMNVSEDNVTETEPLESETLPEIEDGNVMDQNSVPESRLSQLYKLEGADGSNLGSRMNVSEDKVTKTEPLETVTLTETKAENILDQNNVPESRPSDLDNLENTNDLNLGSDINEHLSPKIDIEMVRLKGKVIDESTSVNVDNELKDIYKGFEEPESKEEIGGSSENILEIKEVNKIDDATLYDISVEESELEEVSEATNVNSSPCSPNLIQVASPMIEINTFNMERSTPAPNTLGKVSEDYESRTGDSDYFYNFEKKISTETEITHEGNEATNVDDLPVSPNVTSSIPSDVNLGEPTTAVDTLNLSQATLSFNDCSFAAGDEHRQTPIGIEIGKVDTMDQLSTQSLTRESDFTSERHSPTQKIDLELGLEETQKVEENTVFVEDNSSSAFAKKDSENVDDTCSPKFADMSMNLERESSMEHIDELQDAVMDDVLPKCSIPGQTPIGIEMGKVDTRDQLSTQSLTRESDFTSETESPTQKNYLELGLEETQKVEENTVFVEDNSSSAFAKKDSENVDDTCSPKFADMSMNLERESSMEHIDELRDAVMDDVLPKCSIPEQIQHETDICKVDLEIPSITQLQTSEYNFISNTETPAREIGSQIYFEDTETIREKIVSTEGNNSSVQEREKSEHFDDMDPSNSVDISMNIGVGDSSAQVAEKISGPDMEEKLPKSGIPGSFNNASTSIDVNFEKETEFPKSDANIDGDGDTIMKEVNDSRHGDLDHFDEFSKNQNDSLWQQYSVSITREETPQENISSSFKENDYDSKEIYVEDNNASINFDIGMNLSTRNSLATPTASSNFEDEDNNQDESNRYQGSFENFDQEDAFMVEETWVATSRISEVQHYVNDNINVDQEDNTEHDRTGFVSNISITEEFRNVSGISDAETQEVCPQEMFRDFEATLSATQLPTQEERVTSVQRSIEISNFTKEDVFSNVDSSKHEGSTTVENENKEITVTDMKDSSANQPET